jgi:hypothetical protein
VLLRALFKLARFLLGLGGIGLMLHGVILTKFAIGGAPPFGLLFAASIELLFGFCITYGAFRRFPWERTVPAHERAANEP